MPDLILSMPQTSRNQDDAGRQVREAEAEALKASGGSYGAKVKALIQQLVANRRLGGEAAGGSSATPRGSVVRIKSVVFSQFLGEKSMDQQGRGCVFRVTERRVRECTHSSTRQQHVLAGVNLIEALGTMLVIISTCACPADTSLQA